MAFLQWRRFNFFEKELLNNPADNLVDLIKTCQITCSSSGNGFLILGDSSGLVNFVSRQHSVISIVAYKIAVTHCCFIKYQRPSNTSSSTFSSKISSKSNFNIVTIGTDEEKLVPVLKIWAINENVLQNIPKKNKSTTDQPEQSSTNSPSAECIRTIKLCKTTSSNLNALRVHSLVTSLDVMSDSMIAIGFNDGHVLIIKGELIRNRNLSMKLIQVSATDSVTNVAFAINYMRIGIKQNSKSFLTIGSSSSSNVSVKQQVFLFVSTRHEICSYDLSSRDQEEKLLLDGFGCEIGASCLKQSDPKQLEPSIQFIAGRRDAIYFYNIDGRGPCLAYEGNKLFLTCFRNYLVVVTSYDTSVSRPLPINSGSNSVTSSQATGELVLSNPNLITIYDIEKKFIAYSCPVPAISQIVSEWGFLYVITVDGRIFVLQECDIQTKLELLFQKNQFSLAIDLAKTQTYSQDVLAEMFKQYGDHLYMKGDFDGAINQYCQTLGFLEPSYVIRKFLDLQRIHNLTKYLQEIHKRDLATQDHTTLLINCYVKLKDEDKLNEFLRSKDLIFDVDIAIRVLRQAGYYDNAAMLAGKEKRYDSYFSILLEDKGDFKTVLETFNGMIKEEQHDLIDEYMIKYGRMLIANQPDQTTELLKKLCLFYMKKAFSSEKSMSSSNRCDIADSLLGMINENEGSLSRNSQQFKPENYLHIFLNNNQKLTEFLEFIIEEWKKYTESFSKVDVDIATESTDESLPKIPMKISNTLLEMYIHSYKNEIKEDGLGENRIKIMNFLNDPDSNYDVKKAMILCQMNNFIPGVLFLYEKSKMFKQIVSYFISKKDSQMVIETCKKYGDQEPELWVDALQYFSEIFNFSQTENFSFVLEKIERLQLLPPLIVVEILSKPGKVTLGVVRSYLKRWIKKQQDEIDENERLISSYREECQRVRKHIDDIQNKPKVFQATKCTACSHVLELPSVHFMCNHSFCLTCFENYITEDDKECPICSAENRQIMNELSMFDNVKNVNELFQQELLDSHDPFDVISRYCGQGLFNQMTIVTDDDLTVPKSKDC